MPHNAAARGQMCMASTWLSMDHLRSPLGQVTSILSRQASILQQDDIYVESYEDNEENTSNLEHNLSEGPGDNLSDGLGYNLSKPESTMESENASMRKMMEEQQQILDNAIHPNTQLCMQNI